MYVPKALIVLAMAMSVSAVSTQHIARNMHHRRHAVAARDSSPETPSAPVAVPSVVPRKRQIKRCKAGSPTSSLLSSSAVPTSSVVVTSSTVVSTSVDIQPTSSSAADNVGAASSSSSVFAPSTSAASATSSSSSSSSIPPPLSPSSPSVAPVVTTSSTPSPPPSSSAPPKKTPTSSSAQPAPTSNTPSSTPVQTPTSSAAASSPSPSSSSSGGGSVLTSSHSGDATWYETGLGACGIVNTDTDFIAAASELLFDTFPGYDGVNPNNNPICNMKVTANWGGKSVTVAITDRCTACAYGSLDFSPSAFSQLADQGVGRLTGMTWLFNL